MSRVVECTVFYFHENGLVNTEKNPRNRPCPFKGGEYRNHCAGLFYRRDGTDHKTGLCRGYVQGQDQDSALHAGLNPKATYSRLNP